jgi:hypothetical protein
MKTLIPKNISVPNTPAQDEITRTLQNSMNRYNTIRNNLMYLFQKHDISSMLMYKMSSELTCISMFYYQENTIKYVQEIINNKEQDKNINYNKWMTMFNNPANPNENECWKNILTQLQAHNIKTIELFRISQELQTTSLENFIQGLGQYIEQQIQDTKQKNTIKT